MATRKAAAPRRRSNRAGRKKIAFGWYGGKFSHLDFLLPNLPNDATHFCDVFGGSAAVLINREPAPVETYNDLDSELVNFFATLRHPELGDSLLKEIALTPFSRIEGLPPIIDRLMRVQIENAPGLEVIQRYDTAETLFYLDPPYVHDARGDTHAYYGEMTDADHIELANLLHEIEGRAAVSGYRNELYDALYGDWHRVDAPEKNCHSVRQPRQESLWMNYEPPCKTLMM